MIIFQLNVIQLQKLFLLNNLRNFLNQSFFLVIMSDSTSILDLPTEPIGGNSSLKASENISKNTINLDQSVISEIVNSLQKASISGATQLPSRDIPMTHTIDPHIQPNYVPSSTNKDYIENENLSDIFDNYNKQNYNSFDNIYNEIQTPLRVAILFFLFQLPFFKKNLFNFLPILFLKDGNLNIYGFIFMSSLFGFTFYLTNIIVNL